jgi:H+/Cl- antiporter ClcA
LIVKRERRTAVTIRNYSEKFFQVFSFSPDVRRTIVLSLPLLAASVIVGVAAVAYAQVFAFVEHISRDLFTRWPIAFLVLTPACFFLSLAVVGAFAPFARGSGIPQVMAALEFSERKDTASVTKLVGIRIIAVKIVSSLILLFGGGALGREGPTVQIAGSIFRGIRTYIPEKWPKPSERIMILTGSAAGLAAAFNTPLGGIVFAIEELGKSHFTIFRTSLLTAVIIAGMIAQMLIGPYLYLGYPTAGTPFMSTVGIAIIAAFIAGAAGGVFSKLVLRIFSLKNSLRTAMSRFGFLLVISLLLWLSAYFVTPDAYGSGKDIMLSLLFGSERTPGPVLAAVRFLSPILTFTSGGAAGIFAPSLCSGAAIGGWIASFFSLVPDQLNIVILAGMVAFLTAVTRSPFTSSILVLEMTDRHSLIFVLMLTGLVSLLAAWMIDKQSLYERLKEGVIAEVERESGTKPASGGEAASDHIEEA